MAVCRQDRAYKDYTSPVLQSHSVAYRRMLCAVALCVSTFDSTIDIIREDRPFYYESLTTNPPFSVLCRHMQCTGHIHVHVHV